MADTRIYACNGCRRQEERPPVASGTDDDSARVAGWRIGVNGRGEKQKICPVCVGTDAGFWDRQTVAVAAMAGADAGNPLWGGGA